MKLSVCTLLALGYGQRDGRMPQGRKPVQQRKWERMDRFQKILMKKSIAENMVSSSHVNGGFSSGPHIGTIRHVPDNLNKQQICMDIPTVAEIKSSKNQNGREEQIKRRITIKTMEAVMDGTYQEWIEHLTRDTKARIIARKTI